MEERTHPEPEPTPQERAAACWREVRETLAKHRCQIMPYLEQAIPIGSDGRQAIISASFGVVAQP